MAIKIEEESNNDNNIVKEQFQKSKQGSWIVNKLENYFYWWVEFLYVFLENSHYRFLEIVYRKSKKPAKKFVWLGYNWQMVYHCT